MLHDIISMKMYSRIDRHETLSTDQNVIYMGTVVYRKEGSSQTGSK
jgi:hypothetical protein